MAVTPVAATDVVPLTEKDGFTGRNTAQDIRRGWLTSQWGPAPGSNFTVRTGVQARMSSVLTSGSVWSSLRLQAQSTASRLLDMSTGLSVLQIAGKGPYNAFWDQAFQINMDPSDPTNPRIDLVYAELVDSTGNVGATEHGAYIKVVDGTPAGTPAAPATPTNSIPLWRVYRRAGTTGDQIAAGDLTDVRTSVGLMGAIRPLLGGDALTDPGSYIGELRLRMPPAAIAALGVDHLVDRWGADGQWHGTDSFTLSTTAVTTTANQVGAPGTYHTTLNPLTIPDPGWPYRLRLSGGVYCSVGPNVHINWTWTRGAINGTVIPPQITPGPPPGSTTEYEAQLPATTSPVLTGQQTIYAAAFRKANSPSGNGFAAKADVNRTIVIATVIPA
jgi:hypothetical protein